MKYNHISNYQDEQFRRITGVKRATFGRMIAILNEAHVQKHKRRGREPKLCMEERLLAALEYWREYRTYAHIAASYGIAESNMYQSIKWIEDVLIKDGTFSIPGKKAFLTSEVEFEVVLVDATETPVERPKKKGNENGIQARRSATP